DPGRIVGVRTKTGYRIGEVVRRDNKEILIDFREAEPVSIPIDSLVGLQVNVGRTGRWAQGWGLGFLIGAGTGAVIGLASGDDPPATFVRFTAAEKALVAGGALAIGGSTLGALLGLVAPQRWVPAIRSDGAKSVSIS